MATTVDFVTYVCEQIAAAGDIRAKKMFGEYMVYVNNKPVLLVCDNTVYVKILDCTTALLANAAKASPYDGAKEHYILDIDDAERAVGVALALERVTPVPVKRKRPDATNSKAGR